MISKIYIILFCFVITGCQSLVVKPDASSVDRSKSNKESWPANTPDDSLVPRDGLILWLDPNDVDGDGKFDSDNDHKSLSNWIDKSSKKNKASQSITARQPRLRVGQIPSRPSLAMLSFENNQSLTIDQVNQGRTFFWVLNPAICPANTHFGHVEMGWGTTWNNRMFHGVGSGLIKANGVKVDLRTLDNSWGGPLGGVNFFTLRTDDSQDFSLIGHNFTARSPSDPNEGTMHNFYKGLIGEILVYNRALTDTQIHQVENYLSLKWGIAIKELPVRYQIE